MPKNQHSLEQHSLLVKRLFLRLHNSGLLPFNDAILKNIQREIKKKDDRILYVRFFEVVEHNYIYKLCFAIFELVWITFYFLDQFATFSFINDNHLNTLHLKLDGLHIEIVVEPYRYIYYLLTSYIVNVSIP